MELKIETDMAKCKVVANFSSWRVLVSRELSARASGSEYADVLASRRRCIERWWAGDPCPQTAYKDFVYDMGAAFGDYAGCLELNNPLPVFLYDNVDGGYEIRTDFPYDRLKLDVIANDIAAICYNACPKSWLQYVFLYQDRMCCVVSSSELTKPDGWSRKRFRYVRIMLRKDYENGEKWKDWKLLDGKRLSGKKKKTEKKNEDK